MGISNIHIVLIFAASLVSFILGFWGFSNQQFIIAFGGIILAIILIIYGIYFIKKIKK